MNRARCEKCKTTIESTYRHDFAQCVCSAIFVDGGDDYFRCGYDVPESFTRINDDGTEENMAEAVRKYNEEHPPVPAVPAVDETLAYAKTLQKVDVLLGEIRVLLSTLKDRGDHAI